MTKYIEQSAAVAIAEYAADKHPYDKDPERPETYSDYNQGWNDACDYIMDRIETAHTVDGVDVIRCRDCCIHGNCCVEDVFVFAGISNPFCCAGKRKNGVE